MSKSKPFELFVGMRYVRARRRTKSSGGFVSFISFVSMAGIALGVAALIVVLSVMNGFQEQLRTRILRVASHVQIEPDRGTAMDDWHAAARLVQGNRSVVGMAPYVQEQGMFSYDGRVRGSLVRGIDPAQEPAVSDVGEVMRAGSLRNLRSGEFGVVLGIELARNLGVRYGDKIELVAPQGLVTPAAVLPRIKQFTVVGVFEAGLYEFDSGLALINIEDAQKFYRMGDGVSGLRLKLDDLFQAPNVSAQIAPTLPAGLKITDWTQTHASFFRAVRIEKIAMFVILSLIVAVAAFSIVSALVMAVHDKRADIAILRTLGASPASITAIFMVQGTIMGLIGLVVGAVGGVLLALNVDTVVSFIERLFRIEFFSRDLYYITVSSRLEWSDVTIIVAMAFVLTLVATLYPSWRAARINPAEALRYE